ncbi:hypothetical protein GGR52DRAFT_556333 [Hypoxylon sp. FL1284]|nr:hypothetical protein GGR52DRAFT_556333 [Hypoxylon sp. FL1284]
MEALRSQLHDEQGALRKKTSEYRALKWERQEERAAWSKERQAYEQKIKTLEESVQSLAGAMGSDRTPAKAATGDVTFTRGQVLQAEQKYQRVKDQLEAAQRADLVPIADGDVMSVWNELSQQIQDLSSKKFHYPSLASNREEELYSILSCRWKDYISTDGMSTYLIRALVWRFLCTGLFDKFCRAWGREQSGAALKLESYLMPEATEAEKLSWRARTGALFHKSCQIDRGVTTEVYASLCNALRYFTPSSEIESVNNLAMQIAHTAMELSTIFARSPYDILMSDKPGSSLTRGFPPRQETMEVLKRSSSDIKVVDLMFSPCLLKMEGNDYIARVKAGVIC